MSSYNMSLHITIGDLSFAKT